LTFEQFKITTPFHKFMQLYFICSPL